MKNKKSYVVANLKMNLATEHELSHWMESFLKAKKELRCEETELVLCPQALYLEKFVSKIKSQAISFGVLNCFWQEKGAFTGEISPVSARHLGASYVVLGHSERRFYLGETDEMVAFKINAALKARLRPILCVGEDAKQKKKDQLLEVVSSQLKNCLADVSRGMIEQVIICYEPVWAISANKPAHLPTSNEIMGAKLLIRKFLVEKYGRPLADRVKIIYGGSVDSKNLKEVCLDPGMDGALVGSASLMPYELVKICQLMD